MSIISYAQNFEDVMLWRALKHVQKGFYIDVGAAWPRDDSVTNLFYINGWRGINIEPNKLLNQQLQSHRPDDINLLIALGNCEELVTIQIIGETGLSTISNEIAESHTKNGWSIASEQVQQRTLLDVCTENVPTNQEIHFLKIDVEGAEKSVIEGNDWNIFRPWIVIVEATLPLQQIDAQSAWEYILLNAEYRLAYADGLNRFYVALEHEKLISAFKYPPNVFDDFITYKQHKAVMCADEANSRAMRAEVRAEEAEDRLECIEAEMSHYKSQLELIYKSKSWRIISKLRSLKNRIWL